MYDNLTDSQLFVLHTKLHNAACQLHDIWTPIFHMHPSCATVVHTCITLIRVQQSAVYSVLEKRGALHGES